MPDQGAVQQGFSGFQRIREAKTNTTLAVKVQLLMIGDFIYTLLQMTDMFSDNVMNKYKINGDPPPALIMKLDPEGYEYVLIRNLLLNGLLCPFSVITTEWHHNRGMCSVLNCNRFLNKLKHAVHILQEDPTCRFDGFNLLDDESYILDH